MEAGPPREDNQYGLHTSMNAGLEDMVASNLEGKDSVTIVIFGPIGDGEQAAVFEEWGLVNAPRVNEQLALRSTAVVVHALPVLDANCRFSLDDAPPNDVIPIHKHIVAEDVEEGNKFAEDDEVDEEPFSVIEIAGGIGRVKYRTDHHVDNAPLPTAIIPPATNTTGISSSNQPIPVSSHQTTTPDILKRAAPCSFESVKAMEGKQAGDDSNNFNSNSSKIEEDDMVELTTFLRKLEGRPSLPGLYSDEWLQDFGEEGWEGVVRLHKLHFRTLESDDCLSL
jgi:hypothetical protein